MTLNTTQLLSNYTYKYTYSIANAYLFLTLHQQTPMHTAAKNGDEFILKGLVKLGADINIKDNDGVMRL